MTAEQVIADALHGYGLSQSASGFKVQDVQRLSVADDEVLVFRCKNNITAAQAERLKETAARVFTALRQDQIVVLSGDVDLSVVKRSPETNFYGEDDRLVPDAHVGTTERQ